MSELRLDPTTREWVVVAPERVGRPRAAAGTSAEGCPFCPGNEAQTPPELFRIEDAPGRWTVRVVPNAYPLLTPGVIPSRSRRGGQLAIPGAGHHEVVVESANHQWDMAAAPASQIRRVLEAYRARHHALLARAALVVAFRNHGAASGTSLGHPHSQIVATTVVPAARRHAFDVARRHFDDTGSCLYVDLLDRESAERTRVVDRSARFVALAPFAAAAPYETWILPRTHRAAFAGVSDDELDDLAAMLGDVLSALRIALDDPPYNLIVDSAPPDDAEAPYFLWHLRIVPRISTQAGFEFGTGMSVNTCPPERAAAHLRTVLSRNRRASRGADGRT